MNTFLVSNEEVQLTFTLHELHKDAQDEAKKIYGEIANDLIEVFSMAIQDPQMLPLAQKGVCALRDMIREEAKQ